MQNKQILFQNIRHEILRAICKKSFLYIQYTHPDSQKQDTFFWIGINSLDVANEKINCYGYNLHTKQAKDLFPLSVNKIRDAKVVDETWYETKDSQKLLEDIKTVPLKYENFFGNHLSNLNILDYYEECIRLNNTPYISDDKFHFIEKIDDNAFTHSEIGNEYKLNNKQFDEIIEKLSKKTKDKNELSKKKTLYLCLNLLTIHNKKKGNYVLAYRKLNLDIKNKALKAESEITICKKFANRKSDIKEDAKNKTAQKTLFNDDVSEQKISKFLDNGDLYLLEDFENNLEEIKNAIAKNLDYNSKVDDNPYIFPLERNLIFSLKQEFSEIKKMVEENRLTEPLKAFFGKLIKVQNSKENFPIVLLDNNVNLRQLLAIHNAMKNSVSYIQGPPGTGKTSTIVNTILTAFFNGKTVLFTSYNNKPINGVAEKLKKITYKDNLPLFPLLMIKKNKEIPEALAYVKKIYEIAKTKKVYNSMLQSKKLLEIDKTKQISELLQEYEKKVALEETGVVLEKMLDSLRSMQFNLYLQSSYTKELQDKLKSIKKFDTEKTIEAVNENKQNFFMYIYFKSVELLQQIDLPDYKEFKEILYMPDKDEQTKSFNNFLHAEENVFRLQKIFPIFLSTCISAQKISVPKQFFDLTIMDEASQCDSATAIIPIIRGKNLMLVGDPQQLNPVITMDKSDNEFLKRQYHIPKSYDFLDNSVYKTFIANDAISGETLLSYHYRCEPKIIEFNNKKYYNNKLDIETKESGDTSLIFMPVQKSDTTEYNKAPEEIRVITEYVKNNRQKKIGIITPFRKQREGIVAELKTLEIDATSENSNISCGTVHSFQGDEKDEIIFSLALTNKTTTGTYNWLKCNKELINVATSRAKNKLTLVASEKELERLHNATTTSSGKNGDDIFELYKYVTTNGKFDKITTLLPETQALGLKAFSTETEGEFLETLNNVIANIDLDKIGKKIFVEHEHPISAIFENDFDNVKQYFLQAKFDFVIFAYIRKKADAIPLFAFEVDGSEHTIDAQVIARDQKKEQICASHNFSLIRVPNTYARRYVYIKRILEDFFVANIR